MTVDEFIKILQEAKDTDIAPIEFYIEGQEREYKLESVGQFGLLANVTVHFKEVDTESIMEPATIQRESGKKAMDRLKKNIEKDKQ